MINFLKSIAPFVCALIIACFLSAMVGLGAIVYISYGENTWEVLKTLL